MSDAASKTGPIALLADLPLGDGPKRAHVQMRHGLSSIARRVAMSALAAQKPDVLLEVYAAGIAHALSVLDRDGPSPK